MTSVIGLLYDNIPTVQLLYAEKGVKYKSEKFVPLGSVGRYDPGVIGVRPNSPALTIADAKKKVDTGAGGKGTNQFIIPNLLNKLVGTKFKIVTGYKALGEMMLAIERGEVQGSLGSLSFFKETRPERIRDGKLKWIVQLADERDPEAQGRALAAGNHRQQAGPGRVHLHDTGAQHDQVAGRAAGDSGARGRRRCARRSPT